MAETTPSSNQGTHPQRWKWCLLFAAFGVLALSTQTYLLREFMVALSGDETAVGLGLAVWLTGIAVGAAWARRWPHNLLAAAAGYAVTLLACSSLGELCIARWGRSWLSTPSGELFSLSHASLLAAAVFVLPSLLIGVGFVALVARAAQAGSPAGTVIGRLYVFEALGSLAAGVITSLVLLPHTQPTSGLALIVTLSLACALPAAHAGLVTGYRSLLVLTLAIACVCGSPLGTRLEAATQRVRFASLLHDVRLQDFADTAYAHLDLGAGASHALYVDGTYAISFPDPLEDEARAHALLLLAENPANVLILGSFPAGMLRFMLMHPVTRVDWVTLDRQAFDFVTRHLPAEDRAALADPRTHVVLQDPRSYLKHMAAKYNLVLSLERDPATLLLARQTTTEFAHLVAARLAQGGIYVMRLSSGPNVQAGQTALLGASQYRTLRDSFSFVRATPEPHGLLLAGDTAQAVTLDVATLAQRWQKGPLQARYSRQSSCPTSTPASELQPSTSS